MSLMHPALMQKSGWEWGDRFRELEAAHTWGCPSPKTFDDLPKDYRLEILAWYEGKWRIRAIDGYEAEQKAKSKAKR